ncbi:MAG: 6-phosphogluconolactonase [Desulfuromonadaceae bacterium]|nr:6-phosphogluconolactonase [Desulfuromonadaceae bacterium]
MERFIFPTYAELIQALAAELVDQAQQEVRAKGFVTIALSGGSTPQGLYRLLATPFWRAQIPWSRCWIVFGDERAVGPHHPDSNYAAAWNTLLQHIDVPAHQLMRIHGELGAVAAASDYRERLHDHLPGQGAYDYPQLDIVLLGMGEDGHVASLFPCGDELQSLETVVAVDAPADASPPVARVSLTLPVFNQARFLVILASGQRKMDLQDKIQSQRKECRDLPAARLRPQGAAAWYLSRMA